MSAVPTEIEIPGSATISNGGRKLPRDKPTTVHSTPYRIHYACGHTGKHRLSSKRRIVWRFGFTKLPADSNSQGGTPSTCRGEEHEIELLWSVKSGKVRVCWNKRDISHYFPKKQELDKLEFSWEPRSGVVFRVVAVGRSMARNPQYDLQICDKSFFSLPHLSDLRVIELGCEVVAGVHGQATEAGTVGNAIEIGTMRSEEEQIQDLGFRLSIAGLGSHQSSQSLDDLEDELTSEMFTNGLEVLRQRLTALVHGTEDIVSRTIINTLSEERDCSQASVDSSSSHESLALTAMQVESECLWETSTRLKAAEDLLPQHEMEDRKRRLFQKQLDIVFMHVRRERIGVDAALRILADVATLLGMTLNRPVPRDTIILNQLDGSVYVENVIGALCVFGEIEDAAVSRGRKFGLCRFRSSDSVPRVLAAVKAGTIAIVGTQPSISVVELPLVEQPLVQQRPRKYLRRRQLSEPCASLAKPSLSRRRSHQRNTVTVDTAMTDASFSQVMNEPPLVTPNDGSTVVKPNVFTSFSGGPSPFFGHGPVVSP